MGPDDLPEDIDLAFKGIDGAEAESFIQAVQRSARTEGRSRDNEWIIDLVSTCMTGEALRWYVELDEETQNDWKLLRKAILRQYPPLSLPSTSGLAPIIPTPAAAATPPTPTSVTQSTQAPARIYRIRVYFTDTPSRFFLSTKDEKHICLTNNVARAFTVRSTSKKELKLIESGAETQRMIGLIWYFASKDRHKPSSTSDFALFFLSDSLGNVPPITKYSGAMKMTRWTISNDGWLESKSDVGNSQLTNQFYTTSSGEEGSFTRVCLQPGLTHWNIERDQIFKMKLEPI